MRSLSGKGERGACDVGLAMGVFLIVTRTLFTLGEGGAVESGGERSGNLATRY